MTPSHWYLTPNPRERWARPLLQLVLLVAAVVLIACAGCDHRKCAERKPQQVWIPATCTCVVAGNVGMPISSGGYFTTEDVCVRYVEDGGQ
jgi:hypothetical protein